MYLFVHTAREETVFGEDSDRVDEEDGNWWFGSSVLCCIVSCTAMGSTHRKEGYRGLPYWKYDRCSWRSRQVRLVWVVVVCRCQARGGNKLLLSKLSQSKGRCSLTHNCAGRHNYVVPHESWPCRSLTRLSGVSPDCKRTDH